MPTKTTNRHAHALTLIPPIIISVAIFTLSSFGADGSNAQSGFVVGIVTSVFPSASNISILTTIVRKLAHFTEYTLLGFFTARAFAAYKKPLAWSAVTCIAYSITDELHQLLVPGRSCELTDILIDSTGIILGTLIYCLIHRHRLPKRATR